MLRFELSDESLDRETHVVAVSGEVDLDVAPRLGRTLSELIAAGKTRIVVDLTDTTFIDSTGLSILLSAFRRLLRKQGALALATDNPTVLRLFEITGTDETFDIFATRRQALERVRSGSTAT